MKRKLQLLAGSLSPGASPSLSRRSSGVEPGEADNSSLKVGDSQNQSQRRLRPWLKGKSSHSPVRVPIDLGSEQEEGSEGEQGESPPKNADLWRPAPAFYEVDLAVEDSITGNPDIASDLTKSVLFPKDLEALSFPSVG